MVGCFVRGFRVLCPPLGPRDPAIELGQYPLGWSDENGVPLTNLDLRLEHFGFPVLFPANGPEAQTLLGGFAWDSSTQKTLFFPEGGTPSLDR